MAFPDNCTPRLISVDDSCGCTLTRANIVAMTKASFEAQGFAEVYMDRVIAQTKEARMTGVPQRSLTDLLLSRMAPVKTQTLFTSGGRSVIAPFVLIPQRSNVNANYFVINSGVVDPNAGVGAIPASAWDLTVINESSQFASPLVHLEKYFLPGRFITVFYKDATTGVGHTIQFQIISSANADAGGVSKALLVVQPNYSAAGWAALTAPQKAVYQPTHGVLVPLANSVSNYESWCYNDTSENTMKLLVFWLQTIRETYCYNDEYVKALQAPLTSEFFKKFRTLELAKQRKRQAMLAERAFYDTLFWGDKINENQTDTTYQNLPQVLDPANANCLLEYKANTIGFYNQLLACGKVTDLQGGPLDLDFVKSLLYTLKRNREIDSGMVTRIDCMTDRFTADNILTVMINYYKTKYNETTTRFYKAGETLRFDNQILWNYNVYEFPDENVELCVIVDPYFDDRIGAFPTADKSMSRMLWLLDWSDIKVGVAGTASATRQTNVLDNLYNCVITPNVNHYQLNSKTVCAMVEDPNRHAIITNFSADCPTLTAVACSPIS